MEAPKKTSAQMRIISPRKRRENTTPDGQVPDGFALAAVFDGTPQSRASSDSNGDSLICLFVRFQTQLDTGHRFQNCKPKRHIDEIIPREADFVTIGSEHVCIVANPRSGSSR
jgi:hypothetical protein